ncbi:MAG: sulfatase [Pirellula sp.]|nr:sulfatase [Pirellula sp.]
MNPASQNPDAQWRAEQTRRQFFGRSAVGIGGAALASLLSGSGLAADAGAKTSVLQRFGGLAGVPHAAAKAKRVIYLFQNGAPSHVDLFDYKPMLRKMHGVQIPDAVVGGRRFSTMTGTQTARPCLGEITKFAQHGKSGAWVSDFLPRTAEIADDLCFVKSLHTTAVNHAPAITFFLTGAEQAGRPSLGAWLSYGLGSDTEDLPSFVVMTSVDKETSCGQIFYDFYWGSGFLPTKYQGVKFRGNGDPVLYLSNPAGMSKQVRRGMLDELGRLNQLQLAEYGDPEIATRIAQYEMAYRMQASVPELTDFSDEPEHVLAMYGPDVHRQGSYAYNCLMARRLAERGVRYVQLMHAGWDQHRNLNTQLKIQCTDVDAPSAALVKDLKQRGLLDDTLVIWGGEFGRTPFLQGSIDNTKQWGRDHHPYTFTAWMAGGGIKPGQSYGASDEFGFNAVENKVHVHDFQATILHLLGIDHTRLTYKFQGRYFRLTDVHGEVVKPLLA